MTDPTQSSIFSADTGDSPSRSRPSEWSAPLASDALGEMHQSEKAIAAGWAPRLQDQVRSAPSPSPRSTPTPAPSSPTAGPMFPTSAPFATSPEIASLRAAVSSRLSSLVASLASRTQWPGSEAHPPTNATSGPSVGESFGIYAPDSRCSRTSQACLPLSQELFSIAYLATWPRFGTLASGTLYQQPTLARPTDANGSGSSVSMNWPTATASDAHTDNLASTQQSAGSMHSVTLPQAVTRDWPTPRTSDQSDASQVRVQEMEDGLALTTYNLREAVLVPRAGPPHLVTGPPDRGSGSSGGKVPAPSTGNSTPLGLNIF